MNNDQYSLQFKPQMPHIPTLNFGSLSSSSAPNSARSSRGDSLSSSSQSSYSTHRDSFSGLSQASSSAPSPMYSPRENVDSQQNQLAALLQLLQLQQQQNPLLAQQTPLVPQQLVQPQPLQQPLPVKNSNSVSNSPRYDVNEASFSNEYVFADHIEIPQGSQRHILVKCLPPFYTKEMFYQLVTQFGRVVKCKLVEDKHTKQCLGSAFAEFVDEISAARAIQGLNDLLLVGTTYSLKAGLALPEAPKSKRVDPLRTNVFVGGLPLDMSVTELTHIFSAFGPVVDSRIIANKFVDETGNIRAVGFVRFTSSAHAEKAISSMSGAELRDKNNHRTFKIQCKLAHETSVQPASHPLLQSIQPPQQIYQPHLASLQLAQSQPLPFQPTLAPQSLSFQPTLQQPMQIPQMFAQPNFLDQPNNNALLLQQTRKL